MKKLIFAIALFLSLNAWATVDSTYAPDEYTCNGTLVTFTYTFEILEDDDIIVTKELTSTGTQTALVLNTDYTVTGAGSTSGGTVVLDSGDECASGYTIILSRNIDLLQETDFVDGQAFSAETLENVGDKTMLIDQQQQEEIDRAIKLPLATDQDAPTFPEFTSARVIGYDSSGNLTTYATSVPTVSSVDGATTTWGTIKGRYYVSANATITDHGDSSVDGSLADLITNEIVANPAIIEFPGNTNYTISTNLTIPSTVTLVFQDGAILAIGSGITINFNGHLRSSTYQQIFSYADATSSIVFGVGSVPEINASWWGLTPDGDINSGTGTDNASAFNYAITATKATNCDNANGQGTDTPQQFVGMYIPPGAYLTTSSLFLGSDRAGGDDFCDRVQYLDGGSGAVIIGKHNNPVLDLSGGTKITVKDITIVGDDSTIPTIGILLARSGIAGGTDYNAGDNKFYNVHTQGYFSVSAVYNFASEINKWYACNIFGRGGTAAFIQTSNNSNFAVTTPNTTLPTGDDRSNWGGWFFGCIFTNYTSTGAPATDASVILESVDHGPKFHSCFFNQASDDLPYIKIAYASGTTTRSTYFLLDSCSFHTVSRCGVQIKARTSNMRIVNGNNFGDPTIAAVEFFDDPADGLAGLYVDNAYIEAPTIDGTTSTTDNIIWGSGNQIHAEFQNGITSSFTTNDDFASGDIFIPSTGTLTITGNNYGVIHHTDTNSIHLPLAPNKEGKYFNAITSQNPGAGNVTLAASMLLSGVIDEDPEGNVNWTFDTAANIVAAIPGCIVGTSFQTILKNSATAASGEIVTLVAGAGISIRSTASTLTEGTNEMALLVFRVTNVGSGTEAVSVYVFNGAP